jgi:uncharacterized protein (TIGR00299 family) protein
MTRTAWFDLGNGVAGDMLLGALVDAGAPLEAMSSALAPMALPIALSAYAVDRAGMSATKVAVDVPETSHSRTWRDVRDLLGAVEEPVRSAAAKVFAHLAEAEASVHGIAADDVHFHEVGALDAIADVVACCAGIHALQLDRIVVSPIALGGGTARTAHGTIAIPGPAVLALTRNSGAPVFGGPESRELATPTGVALVTAFADEYGPLPQLVPDVIGVGAGHHNPVHRANVVRMVIGNASARPPADGGTAIVLEANIDDMDPRMWPGVLAGVLDAGAADAWLIPIAMKKGRPAHTLCAIVAPDRAAGVRTAIFANTTTLGIRETSVAKHALRREFRTVIVDGQSIAVKLGLLPTGEVVNAMPEWEDVSRAAIATERPVKSVLAEALGLASQYTTEERRNTIDDLDRHAR